MEMESLHSPVHTDTAEPGPSAAPPSYRDAQVWKDIEAETGFGSSADYFEYYKDVNPDMQDNLRIYRELPKNNVIAENKLAANERSSIVIYDLSEQESALVSLNLRRHCDSGTELIQALREPPRNVRMQVVLWFCQWMPLSKEMVDALILGLKADFQDLRGLNHEYELEIRPPTRFRAPQIKELRGTFTTATISEAFMPDTANSIPVLLIVSHLYTKYDNMSFEELLAEGGLKGPPVSRSALTIRKPVENYEGDEMKRHGQLYAKTVEHFISRGQYPSPTKAFLLLAAMSPLVDVEAYRIGKALDKIKATIASIRYDKSNRRVIPEEQNQNLDIERFELRRILEDAEENFRRTVTYVSHKCDPAWLQEPSYINMEADWKRLTDEASRVEAEVRDHMQLQVGNLALEESRRSIELSNVQIRESKRVKIVTILAFVYVPLNLATSIFGMNIQQLNKSGQNLWVFFLTAIVALLVTGGSWLGSDSTYKAVEWYKKRVAAKRVNEKGVQKGKYGVLVRLAMLVWLLRNGHKKWMWVSGAWIAILIDSKTAPSTFILEEDKKQSACDYVTKNSVNDDLFSFTAQFGVVVFWSPKSTFLSIFSRSTDPELDSSDSVESSA